VSVAGSEYDTDLDPESNLIELTRDGEQYYYFPSAADLTHDSSTLGQVIICTDVTTVERQRQEVHRQNDQLEGFSAAVAHELRNTLAIVDGNLTLVGETVTSTGDEKLINAVQTSLATLDRMKLIVNDLTTLARYAQTVDEMPVSDFRETFSGVPLLGLSSEVTIELDGEGKLKADPERVKELLRQAARLTVKTGGTRLLIELTNDGFVLTTNGESLLEGNASDLFTYGTAVPKADAGMLGPNIQALTRAHGWGTTVDSEYQNGIRIRITGVKVLPEDS
jgi:signal transduction histidine kinase